MNESVFVKKNMTRWEQLENFIKSRSSNDPDSLAAWYIQLTDDLAYARTHFPEGEITQYLNNLTTQLHRRIYKNKREERGRIWRFWKYEVPEVCYRYRRYILYSFLVFFVSSIIGAVSVANDATFVRLIMGDQYVNMTEENIANNDPMAVYKKMGRADMFLAITYNNVRVSLLTFAAGILTSIGTGFLLFNNGVMLGAFQYFFYQKGLLADSALTLWIHGTLEISAIILAGAAGMIMGNSMLFPGTYSRMHALRRGAKDGLKLVTGLVPVFIVAGFLEGFITRLTGAPTLVKLIIIFGSLAFILYYFIIYPKLLFGNVPKPKTQAVPAAPLQR